MQISKIKTILMCTALCTPMIAAAQEVTLKALDGSLDLTGELIEYQDNVYVLSSNFGAIRVDGDTVECIGAACPITEILDQEVTISGSDTVAEGLVPLLLAGYAAGKEAEIVTTETISGIETNVQFIDNLGFGDLTDSFRVRSSVSSDAFSNLLGQSAEIGISSRRITVEEARALRDAGAGSMVRPSNEHILANDSIIVVTSPTNPVKTMTTEQLAGIYNGTISNWSEVGGNDAPISAIHLQSGSGTRSVFESRILDGQPGQPVSVVAASDIIDVSRQIEANENAIGYLSLAFQRGTQGVTLINECGIAMEPDAFSTKTGEYLLQRPLYFYTRPDTITDEVQEFLTWAKSGEANTTIEKSGFIDLSVARNAQGPESARATSIANAGLDTYEASFADQMIGMMANHDRLSTTFRFNTGSNRLTPQSRDGLERFVNYLEDQPEGELLLVGFTDDQGPFDANLNLSLSRAEFMVSEIQNVAQGRLDHITFKTNGFGELAPVSCNSAESGRATNRRIEVWTPN